jgi:hypothetical protein
MKKLIACSALAFLSVNAKAQVLQQNGISFNSTKPTTIFENAIGYKIPPVLIHCSPKVGDAVNIPIASTTSPTSIPVPIPNAVPVVVPAADLVKQKQP